MLDTIPLLACKLTRSSRVSTLPYIVVIQGPVSGALEIPGCFIPIAFA